MQSELFSPQHAEVGGMGIQILSTPRGIISDRRARAEEPT